MPPERLRDVRQQVESGQFALTPDMQRAVLERVDDIIKDIEAAELAFQYKGKPDLTDAASRTAHLFYISGHGWRRFLTASAESARAGIAIGLAVRDSVAPVLAQLVASVDVSKTTLVRRGHTSDASYTLTCCVCGGDAVTFARTRTGPEAPEQVVLSSISPVTVFRSIAGPRMIDLLALLEGGNAGEVIKYLAITQPAGCDACCPMCEGVYCKAHTAVEAQWTGSWHEATYATCPLGHEREIG